MTMGREVKRVPLDFEWPLGRTWWGFTLPPVPCQQCGGNGKRPGGGKALSWTKGYEEYAHETEYCDMCEGEGKVCPELALPCGPGWQMWETTSEGSPISPVFQTPEELARWLADNRASAFGRDTATYAQWLAMILKGWAPSMVVGPDGIKSGVDYVADNRAGGDGQPSAREPP
jgi:hypothetical protein